MSLMWLREPSSVHSTGTGRTAQPVDALSMLSATAKLAPKRSVSDFPKLFVSIPTLPDRTKERSAVRKMWNDAKAVSPPVPLSLSFTICQVSPDATLLQEMAQHGDIAVLHCDEGYGHGLLTMKVISALRAWQSSPSRGDLFYKVDDDTFVHLPLFLEQVVRAWRQYHGFLYMGVDVLPEPRKFTEPNNTWHEPRENFPEDMWPRYMPGGTGYILGSALVDRMLDWGLPETHFLWNEDRAVSVWVRELERGGVDVHRVGVNGSQGYGEKPWNYCQGLWSNFTFSLVHRVDASEMMCLSSLALKNDPSLRVDPCFELCPKNYTR